MLPDKGQHPRFLQLERYLESKAPPGGLPGRQDIDPVELKSILAYINLFDVVRGSQGLRFRFRLMGSAQSEALGRDCTGKFIDEVFPPKSVEPIQQVMREVVDSRLPHFDEYAAPFPERQHVRFQRALFPLASDGRTVDMLIAAYVFPPLAGSGESILQAV
jgi:hypothetical protein